MAVGYTEDEARQIIVEDGQAFDRLMQARKREIAAAMSEKARWENKRFPIQPDRAKSVKAIPVNFEGNRRRH